MFVASSSQQKFLDFMANFKLIEMGFNGNLYTWSNKKVNE